jgi:hypothetical protein
VYDNGRVQIYDLAALIGKVPAPAGAGAAGLGGDGANWPLLAGAVGVAGIWLLRRRFSPDPDGAVRGALWVVVGAIGASLVVVASGLPATPIAAAVLAAALALGLRPLGSRAAPSLPRRWRAATGGGGARQLAWAALGCAVLGVGIGVSVTSASAFWRAPTSLSVLDTGHGSKVATVHVGSGTGDVTLRVVSGGRVQWSDTHRTSGNWAVTIPAKALSARSGSRPGTVELLMGNRVVREVQA